jgi:hypothetical protein
MIPMMNIIAWSNVVPWAEQRQVEQDLIISRAILDLFADPFLREQLRYQRVRRSRRPCVNPEVRVGEGRAPSLNFTIDSSAADVIIAFWPPSFHLNGRFKHAVKSAHLVRIKFCQYSDRRLRALWVSYFFSLVTTYLLHSKGETTRQRSLGSETAATGNTP